MKKRQMVLFFLCNLVITVFLISGMIYLSAKTVFKNDYVLMKNYGQLAAMHIDIKDVLTFSALLKKIIKIENAHIKTLNKIREHKVFKRQRMSFDEIKDYALVLYWWHIKYKLNINYFIANTIAESDMMPNVISKAGAKGLNQIMPYVFKDFNANFLKKFGKVDIFDVYHNTDVAACLWIKNREKLKFIYKRPPTLKEMAYAYNFGLKGTIKYINSKNKNFLPQETIKHGKVVNFYYKMISEKKLSKNYYQKKHKNP